MKSYMAISIQLVSFLVFATTVRAAEPLFVNSVVSTDFDFIQDDDPNVLQSVHFSGVSQKEMPDSRNDELFAKAYVFNTTYSDNTRVEIWAHEDFGSQAVTEVYVKLLADALGQQPHFNRVDLNHVVMHKGDETAYAEESGKFFVIYSGNMDTRIHHHDLQETVFHECAHVAYESVHASASGWIQAQQADAGFITHYAKDNPIKEDIPESAIFAFVLLNHPNRLDAAVETQVRTLIPNRIAYFSRLPGFLINHFH